MLTCSGSKGFTKKFGVYNPTLQIYALPAWLSSLMTSLPFLGKALVCLIFDSTFPVEISRIIANRLYFLRVHCPAAGLPSDGDADLPLWFWSSCLMCKERPDFDHDYFPILKI